MGDARQLFDHEGGIAWVRIDAGADCGRPQIDLPEVRRSLADAGDILLEGREEGIELLAEGHRHSVLELGAPNLQDVGELDRLGLEREG
jgi:hypothetical protein